MKTIGYILITVGFLAGTLCGVWSEDFVYWLWFVPSILIGAAGVAFVQLHIRKTRTSHKTRSTHLRAVIDSLNKLVANTTALSGQKNEIPTYDFRHRIDELLAADLIRFADQRESISAVFGLQIYANVMSYFAAGERYINRTWCASADGYVNEVKAYIDKALQQFTHAQSILNSAAQQNQD